MKRTIARTIARRTIARRTMSSVAPPELPWSHRKAPTIGLLYKGRRTMSSVYE
jgi:hypothetical protein